MQEFHTEPPEDNFDIEIVDLDTTEQTPDASARPYSSGFHLSRRARIWLVLSSGIALLVLFVLIFPFHLPSSTTTKKAQNTPLATVQTLYDLITFGDITCLTTSDGMLHALRTKDGTQVWQHENSSGYFLTTNKKEVLYLVEKNGPGEKVEAVRIRDGKLLWTQNVPELGLTPLIMEDGEIQNFSYQSSRTIIVLRAEDGKVLWNRTLSTTDPDINLSIQATQHVVYVSEQAPNSNQFTLLALKSSDGSLLWQSTYKTTSTFFSSTQTLGTDRILLSLQDGSLKVLQGQDGHTIWSYPLAGSASWGPILQDNTLYLGPDKSSLVALNADNGAVLWNYKKSNGILQVWAVTQSAVYLQDTDGDIVALLPATGRELWRAHPFPPATTLTRLESVDEMLYVVAPEDAKTPGNMQLYVLSAADGKLLWHSPLNDGGGPDSFIVRDGKVYISTAGGSAIVTQQASAKRVVIRSFPSLIGGKVYYSDAITPSIQVLQASNGKVLWSLKYSVEFYNTFRVDDNIAFVRTNQGAVEAYRPDNGRLLWRYPKS